MTSTSSELAQYYKTPAWAAKRRACLALHRWQCDVCGDDWRRRGDRLQAHHLHYRTVGREDPARDLRPLCTRHHPKGELSRLGIQLSRDAYRWDMRLRQVSDAAGRWLWAVVRGFVLRLTRSGPRGRTARPARV